MIQIDDGHNGHNERLLITMDVHWSQWTFIVRNGHNVHIKRNIRPLDTINGHFDLAASIKFFRMLVSIINLDQFHRFSKLTKIVHCVQWTLIVFIVSIVFNVLNGRPMCTLNAHWVYSVHCTQLTSIVHNKRKLCTLCPLGTMNVYCDQWTYIVSNVTLCPLCTINVHCDQWTFIVSIVFIVSIIPIMLIGRNQPKCNLQPIDVVWVCPLWTLKWTQWTSIVSIGHVHWS